LKSRVFYESETVGLASGFAASLKPGDVVALSGELGAGKSVFCRAVMRALGVTDKVLPSPTFSIIQEYEADGCMVAHMDWYRLETVDEIEMLGVREYFQPPWICLIEWPERAMELLDDTVIHIAMTFPASDPDSRWIGITSPHYS
jgi:tRNA threonylcarbamoyladenosine biosynthesis protein TsaE